VSFNPANALVSMGWEDVPSIPPATFNDFKFVSEDLASEAPVINSESIENNSQRPIGAPSKIDTAGSFAVELDPEGHARLIAATQGMASVTNPLAGVYIHKLAPSEVSLTVPGTFGMRVWRDDSMPQIFKGGRMRQWEVSLEPRGFLKSTFSPIFERADYWSDAVVVVEASANANHPVLQGLPRHADWITTAAAGEVFVKVSDITDIASGIIKFLCKVGSGAYGVTETTIQCGLDSDGRPIMNDLYRSDGTGLVGTRAMPVQLHLADPVGYQVDDAYKFTRERAVWTPSYPDVPIFNEIFAYIYLDGVKQRIRQFTLTVVRPVEAIHAIGGRFAWEVRERGQREVNISIEREYLNTAIRKRLEAGEPFGLRVEAYTGDEFETGHEHELFLVCPKAIAGGRTAVVGGKAQLDESISATCHPDPTNVDGDVDDLTVYLKNSIADLTV